MDDLIRRQDAIDVHCELCGDRDTCNCDICPDVEVFQLFPSAQQWIPIKGHYITEEEQKREGYPEDWVYYLDCKMPEDGEDILITTKNGYVHEDVCEYDDGSYYLDSGYDWVEDVLAWMPLPAPWKGDQP